MVCKICGKNQFVGHQIIRADVLVDGDGEFADNLPGGLEGHIYDAGKPYGPFTCVCCGAEYDELVSVGEGKCEAFLSSLLMTCCQTESKGRRLERRNCHA